MVGETSITRIGTEGAALGFYLSDILIGDSRNRSDWFPQGGVIGIIDVLESPELLEDGMGKSVDNLYKRIAIERNACAGQRGAADFKLAFGGVNARILEVRYQTVNERIPRVAREFHLKEYIQMGRPRYLLCERKVTDTFRGVQEFGSGVL